MFKREQPNASPCPTNKPLQSVNTLRDMYRYRQSSCQMVRLSVLLQVVTVADWLLSASDAEVPAARRADAGLHPRAE